MVSLFLVQCTCRRYKKTLMTLPANQKREIAKYLLHGQNGIHIAPWSTTLLCHSMGTVPNLLWSLSVGLFHKWWENGAWDGKVVFCGISCNADIVPDHWGWVEMSWWINTQCLNCSKSVPSSKTNLSQDTVPRGVDPTTTRLPGSQRHTKPSAMSRWCFMGGLTFWPYKIEIDKNRMWN